ncbi:hypothetical protein CON47_03980 [Bacillus thuringiensis]|nr:hypothetical protein CON47_03980 [Bacillus thuringiensis]TKH81167.1 hypothetical protein FC688_13550 [Bacillus cereus]
MLQGCTRLSYVILTRDFNMNVAVKILVNVSNLFRDIISNQNAIWLEIKNTISSLKKVRIQLKV